MKKELIKEIKKHTKVVLKRADEQKLEMEYPEGYEKATEEVLVKHMDQEKASRAWNLHGSKPQILSAFFL